MSASNKETPQTIAIASLQKRYNKPLTSFYHTVACNTCSKLDLT